MFASLLQRCRSSKTQACLELFIAQAYYSKNGVQGSVSGSVTELYRFSLPPSQEGVANRLKRRVLSARHLRTGPIFSYLARLYRTVLDSSRLFKVLQFPSFNCHRHIASNRDTIRQLPYVTDNVRLREEVFNLTHDRKFDFELIKEYEDFLAEMNSGALTCKA